LDVNIGILGFFKYYDFFAGSLAALLRIPPSPVVLQTVLPVGVSFYTDRSCWIRLCAADLNWSFRFVRCGPASFAFSLKCRLKGITICSLRPSDRALNARFALKTG